MYGVCATGCHLGKVTCYRRRIEKGGKVDENTTLNCVSYRYVPNIQISQLAFQYILGLQTDQQTDNYRLDNIALCMWVGAYERNH